MGGDRYDIYHQLKRTCCRGRALQQVPIIPALNNSNNSKKNRSGHLSPAASTSVKCMAHAYHAADDFLVIFYFILSSRIYIFCLIFAEVCVEPRPSKRRFCAVRGCIVYFSLHAIFLSHDSVTANATSLEGS